MQNYSTWFRSVIKDPDLADETAAVEQNAQLNLAETRKLICDAINWRYTAPARKGANRSNGVH
jgi:hypothetical protein